VLTWPSATFKAHWAIFVPALGDRSAKKGKYIHVEGNVREGFTLEIRRGYDISKTRNHPRARVELGWIQADLIDETTLGLGAPYQPDTVVRDRFEELCAAIPAPAPTLRSAATSDVSYPLLAAYPHILCILTNL
jgi:hypothetical protein